MLTLKKQPHVTPASHGITSTSHSEAAAIKPIQVQLEQRVSKLLTSMTLTRSDKDQPSGINGREKDTHRVFMSCFPQGISYWLTCCWTSSSALLLPVLSSWHRWLTLGPEFDWMTSTVRGVTTPWRPMGRANWPTSSLHAHLPNYCKVRWCMRRHTSQGMEARKNKKALVLNSMDTSLL